MSESGCEQTMTSSDDASTSLAEIIAEQKKFQVWRDRGAANAQNQAAVAEDQAKLQTFNKQSKQRRKFSLSFNLPTVSFVSNSATANSGSSSSSVSGNNSSQKGNEASLRKPLAADNPSAAQKAQQPPLAKSLTARTSASERRRQGFISRAIRRGSKIFDSMIQFSTSVSGDHHHSRIVEQRQHQQQQHHRNTSFSQDNEELANKLVDNVIEETISTPDDKISGKLKSACKKFDSSNEATHEFESMRVQFESNVCEHADEGVAKSKRRRLRLGSIPHDLRRALSLGGASLHSEKQAVASKLHVSPHDDDGYRGQRNSIALRRKSSLFSALSGHTTNDERRTSHANNQSASFSICQDHSRTYKLIVFGASAVGKTALIQRFFYGKFPTVHKPTVEELHSNKYTVPELGEIYLEILDTSGTFEFPAMRRLSIEKGDAFILVYSVRDESSWHEVVSLRKLICDEKAEQRARKKNKTNAHVTICAPGRRTSSTPTLKSELLNRRLSVHRLPENIAPVALGALTPTVLTKYRRQSSLDELNDKQTARLVALQRPLQNSADASKSIEFAFEQTKTPIVVVANKCDSDYSDYQVNQANAERLVVNQWKHSFVECSAKDAINVDRVFRELLRQAAAPEAVSKIVIDDHKKRRKSLPNIRSQHAARAAAVALGRQTPIDELAQKSEIPLTADDSQCEIS